MIKLQYIYSLRDQFGPAPMAALALLFLTAAFMILVVHYVWKEASHRTRSGPLSLPVMGGSLSVLWNLHHLHDYVTRLSAKHGTFRISYPGFDYYFIVHPANLEYLLKTNFHNYVKGKFVCEKQQEFLGDGIFSVDGVEWKQQRRVASYEFSTKALREFCEATFCENAVKLARFLLSTTRGGEPVKMQDAFLRLTFDSYCKVGFGVEMNTLQRNPLSKQISFLQTFDNCNSHVFLRYVDPLWKLKRWLRVGREAKFAKDITKLEAIVFGLIEQKRRLKGVSDSSCQVQSDLLSRFLALSETDPGNYTDKKIKDIIINFMLAGRDTTALTLSWFLYLLCQNSDIQQRLVEEIRKVVYGSSITPVLDSMGSELPIEEQIQSFTESITYDKLNQMHYLQACLQETLRLFPPVPNDPKIAIAADTLPDGTRVRKGDCVNIALYAMGRMEWLWGNEAMDFKPDRFMKNGVCQQESPFKLPAFLGGPRMCLGKDFAFLQMKVTVATLLWFFSFKIVPSHRVKYRVMLTLHMAQDGLMVNVCPRTREQRLEGQEMRVSC